MAGRGGSDCGSLAWCGRAWMLNGMAGAMPLNIGHPHHRPAQRRRGGEASDCGRGAGRSLPLVRSSVVNVFCVCVAVLEWAEPFHSPFAKQNAFTPDGCTPLGVAQGPCRPGGRCPGAGHAGVRHPHGITNLVQSKTLWNYKPCSVQRGSPQFNSHVCMYVCM